MTVPILLLPGGIWEPASPELFWCQPGVVAGLEARGRTVITPQRLRHPPTWQAELDHLLPLVDRELILVGPSNAAGVAVRLALIRPELVRGLVLAWPATGGDAEVDARTRAGLVGQGVEPATVEALLAGETLRGVTDGEVARLGGRKSVAVVPAEPENRSHQRKTVDALLRLVPGMFELPGTLEPPLPGFAEHRELLVDALAGFADRAG